MPRAPTRILSAFALLAALDASIALACPRCAVATGAEYRSPSLDENAMDEAAGAAPERSWFGFNIGFDIPSAYLHRGYVQADQGFIFQPYLTLSAVLPNTGEWVIEPYAKWVNTFLDTPNGNIPHQHGSSRRTVTRTEQYLDPGHASDPTPHYHEREVTSTEGATGKGWFESQITGGITLTRNDLELDLKYHVCLFPEDSHDAVQEVGGRVSYDLAGLWDESNDRAFSLRPFVLMMIEINDANGEENTFIEAGIDPQWRGTLLGQRVAVSTPVSLTASPDGYFIDDDGTDATLGNFIAAIRTSWQLPSGSERVRIYLNASVTFYRFLAGSTELSNGGDDTLFVGSIGMGLAF